MSLILNNFQLCGLSGLLGESVRDMMGICVNAARGPVSMLASFTVAVETTLN